MNEKNKYYIYGAITGVVAFLYLAQKGPFAKTGKSRKREQLTVDSPTRTNPSQGRPDFQR